MEYAFGQLGSVVPTLSFLSFLRALRLFTEVARWEKVQAETRVKKKSLDVVQALFSHSQNIGGLPTLFKSGIRNTAP